MHAICFSVAVATYRNVAQKADDAHVVSVERKIELVREVYAVWGVKVHVREDAIHACHLACRSDGIKR